MTTRQYSYPMTEKHIPASYPRPHTPANPFGIPFTKNSHIAVRYGYFTIFSRNMGVCVELGKVDKAMLCLKCKSKNDQ